MVVGDQHAAGHVAGEAIGTAIATADAGALHLAFVFGLVLEIAPAQGARAQAVFVGFCGAGDDAAIELGVLAHFNLIAALAGEQPGLFLHALVLGVDLALADADRGAARHRAEREAGTAADIALLGLVVVGVLQTLQREVAPDLGRDLVRIDLRALERGVPPTDQACLVTGVQGGLGPGGTGAFFLAHALVAVGEDAQACAVGANAQAHANGAAAAAVLAIKLLPVGRGLKLNVTLSGEQHVITRLELAALHADIAIRPCGTATGSHNGKVVATGQATALTDHLLLSLLGTGLLRAQGNADTDELANVIAVHPAALLGRLPGLDTGQASLDALQGREAAIVLLLGLLGGLVRGVDGTADGSGQRQGQAAGLGLGGLLALVVIFRREDVDVLPDETDVLAGDDVGTFKSQVLAGLDVDVAQHTANGAGLGVFGGAGRGVLSAS